MKPPHLRRARYARPQYYRDLAKRLRASRSRPLALQLYQRANYAALGPRRRTRFASSAGTAHYLAARRAAAAQCRRRGFERLRPGVWYDRAADVFYLQSDVIYTCDNITRAVRYV